MLNLMEELLLLALDDEKGKIISSSSCALPYGLRGALLLELFLAEKIDVVDKKIVVIVHLLRFINAISQTSFPLIISFMDVNFI